MNVPQHFLIGAQKCATTWLYLCLREHPELFLPVHKREFEYLANPQYQTEGLDRFFALFDQASEDQVIVDVSVEYFFDPLAAELVHKEVPNARFIVALRNPIERALSAYAWNVRKGFLPDLPIDEGMRRVLSPEQSAVSVEERDAYTEILERGFYDVQLERYLRCFEPDRFLIVLYDHIVSEPKDAIRQIFAFLEVATDFRPNSLRRRPKVTTHVRPLVLFERLFPSSRDGLPKLTARAAGRVTEFVNEGILRLGFRRQTAKLDSNVRVELSDVYRSHTQKLQEMLSGIKVVGADALPHLDTRWS